MSQTFDLSYLPRINASQYASRGLVSCTKQGKVVWWGPLPNIVQAPAFEIVHCNEEDVREVTRVLSGGQRKARR